MVYGRGDGTYTAGNITMKGAYKYAFVSMAYTGYADKARRCIAFLLWCVDSSVWTRRWVRKRCLRTYINITSYTQNEIKRHGDNVWDVWRKGVCFIYLPGMCEKYMYFTCLDFLGVYIFNKRAVCFPNVYILLNQIIVKAFIFFLAIHCTPYPTEYFHINTLYATIEH